VWEYGGINLCILNLGIKWGWLASFTLLPLYPHRERQRCSLSRRLDGPQRRSAHNKENNYLTIQNLRYSQQYLWRVISYEIQLRVVRWKSTDVSEEYIASIFRVEKISRARNERGNRWECLLDLFFWPAEGGDVPPKRGLTFDGLHGVVSQKRVLFYLLVSCLCWDSNTNSLVVQSMACYLYWLNYSGSNKKPRPPNMMFEEKWEFCGCQVQAVDVYGRAK
jgi:hypothetical protein